jgi:tRNA isopentenyl-2-thiomethyl-A-37 hydroxylase MiaE
MNAKQEQLLKLIKKKKECDKRAQDTVLKLIEKNVTEQYLLDNVSST